MALENDVLNRRIPGRPSIPDSPRARLLAASRRVPQKVNRLRLASISAGNAVGGLSYVTRSSQATFTSWPMPSSSKMPALQRAFFKPSLYLAQAQAAGIRQSIARRVLWRA